MNFGKVTHPEKEKRSLRERLHRHLAHPSPGRSARRIHASDLDHEDPAFCPRERALRQVLNVKDDPEKVMTASRVAFRISRVVQDEVAHWFAEIGMAMGQWECPRCDAISAFGKRPEVCAACTRKSRHWRYREMRFESKWSGVTGGIDLILARPESPKLGIVEIKALHKEDFKALVMPIAEHRWRTGLYLRLIAESDSPWSHLIDTEQATILYVAKGGWGQKDSEVQTWGFEDGPWSPFKEYTVFRHDAGTQQKSELARRYFLFREGLGPMPEGICPTQFCLRAKQCPVVNECFGGQYPAGESV